MCGIAALLSSASIFWPEQGFESAGCGTSGDAAEADGSLSTASLEAYLLPRGPDNHGNVTVCTQALRCSATMMEVASGCITPPFLNLQLHVAGSILQLLASLLQLRGIQPILGCTPLVDKSTGNILCFNGEVIGGLHVPPGANDGQCLLEALLECDVPGGPTGESAIGLCTKRAAVFASAHARTHTHTHTMLMRIPKVCRTTRAAYSKSLEQLAGPLGADLLACPLSIPVVWT